MTYNPEYSDLPFTDFHSINRSTDIGQLNFNWREIDLPERERTKHVHRLHPYLGKYIPQLVEIFLRKYSPKIVLDPFMGSGTTLVEANVLKIHSIGSDVSAFNCLLASVKTREYQMKKLDDELKDIIEKTVLSVRSELFRKEINLAGNASDYLRKWFAPEALNELLYFRSLINNYENQDVMKVILSRAARSARLTTHFDLDFPKKPQLGPYECYKHRRICKPTTDALRFLERYTIDTRKRIEEFSKIRTRATVDVIRGDSRFIEFPKFDMVLTSPPYVGLIDYHEQHRYSYELLDLPSDDQNEIGPAKKGKSRKATVDYLEGISLVFQNVRRSISQNGVVVIVVNDKDELYNGLAEKIGFNEIQRFKRHVNRRTGRRANDFYEEILIWKPNARIR